MLLTVFNLQCFGYRIAYLALEDYILTVSISKDILWPVDALFASYFFFGIQNSSSSGSKLSVLL